MLIRYAVMAVMTTVLCLGCAPREYDPQSNPNVASPLATTEPEVLPTLKNFSPHSQRLTIMTWNLENLFDTIDNPATDDEAYLPLALKQQIPGFKEDCEKKGALSWINQCLNWDWTEDVLNLKMSRLAQVIMSVNHGQGPDILVVQEVENLNVLEQLIEQHMPHMGYKAYLIENHDSRGIDVGLITRLTPTKTPELSALRSRPGLVMQFDLGQGEKLNLIGVHFPISPTPAEKRLKMFEALAEMAQENNHELTIAAGDFNFPKALQEKYDIINSYAKPKWVVSHLYCQPQCQGTFFDAYDSSWSQLDFILLSKNFLNKDTRWTLDPQSVQVYHPFDFQNSYDGVPLGFNLPNKKGASDHWPLVIQLVRTDKK